METINIPPAGGPATKEQTNVSLLLWLPENRRDKGGILSGKSVNGRKTNGAGLVVNILMTHAISMKIVDGRRLLHVSHVGFRPGTSTTHVTSNPATTMDARAPQATAGSCDEEGTDTNAKQCQKYSNKQGWCYPKTGNYKGSGKTCKKTEDCEKAGSARTVCAPWSSWSPNMGE